MWNDFDKNKQIKFRIAENIRFDGSKFFIPQIQEDEDEWQDIDFDGEEFSVVYGGNGELKCNTLDEAQKVIKSYVEVSEEELRTAIKEVIYHMVEV